MFHGRSDPAHALANPFQPQYQYHGSGHECQATQPVGRGAGQRFVVGRQQVGLLHGLHCPMAVLAPGQRLLPRPDLVQGTDQQTGRHGHGGTAGMQQQPGHQPRKTQHAGQTPQGEDCQQRQVEGPDGPENSGIETKQHQDETTGYTRQDHGADGNRAGQENHRQGRRPLQGSGTGEQIGKGRGPQGQGNGAQVPALHFPTDHVYRDQDQAEEERPDQFRMCFQQITDQAGDRGDAGQDAAQQGRQESPIDGPPGFLDAAPGQPYQLVRGAGTQGREQTLIDAGDQRDGAARDAG